MLPKKMLVAAQPETRPSRPVVKWLIVGFAVLAVAALFAASVAILAGYAAGGKVALIRVSGQISGSEGFFVDAASPDEIIGMIEKAEKGPAIRGMLIEINSPGGSAVASEEIMKAVYGAEKPTVALIRDIGTSGAYWVASASDHVVASPVSITGSVGVLATYLEFSEFIEGYGVKYERLVAGQYKDIGSPFRNLTGEERGILQEGLDKMHGYFLESVRENRGLTDEAAIARISTAVIFLGTEAMELGLVDELGGKAEAEEWLKGQTGLEEINYVTYEKKPLFGVGGLLAEQSSSAGAAFGKSLVAQIISTATAATTASFGKVRS